MLIVSPRGWNFSHPFHTIGETFLLFLAETKIDQFGQKEFCNKD